MGFQVGPPGITAALLARPGTKKERGEFRFQCIHPERHEHGDAHPSGRWNEKKAVWCCDVCGGGWKSLAKALGIDEQRARPPKAKARRRVVSRRAWSIIDANGHVLAEHVRVDYSDGAKGFVWRRNGGQR